MTACSPRASQASPPPSGSAGPSRRPTSRTCATAAQGLTAPDVQRVYQQLLSASQQHLAAFEHRL